MIWYVFPYICFLPIAEVDNDTVFFNEDHLEMGVIFTQLFLKEMNL